MHKTQHVQFKEGIAQNMPIKNLKSCKDSKYQEAGGK